jgi:hypothetical protein
MMTKDEAIHKALKVLNCLNNDRVYETAWVKGAINACEEALEQPAQEVMELEEALKHCDGKDCNCYAYYQGECACDADWTPEEVVKLRYQLNNTHPHQWQGLTDDEMKEIIMRVTDINIIDITPSEFAISRAIEQALKEKNHE